MELTQLEEAIEKLVTTFLSCAGQEGSMTPDQFRALVQLQLPSLVQDIPSLEEKMQELDVNKDHELEFSEYWKLMGEVAKAIRREDTGKQ
ncbi:protein S100-A13 [Melopsittacus undulatus]|uniref:Uncharacterized protein n=1 Tax=Melopsittacus undulatus TaxID=13146 RepID=A0A8V5GVS3_MELUD|nr:protein S100-A13 [Melopsittacus undulatus]